MSQQWECLVAKKVGDDVSGDFASNAGMTRFNGIADFADDMLFYTGDQPKFDANWITSDSTKIRGNPSTNVIDWQQDQDNSSDAIRFDLWSHGIFPSDTNWTLRWKFTVTTQNFLSGNNELFMLRLTSNSAGLNFGTVGEFIGFAWSFNTLGGAMFIWADANNDAFPNDMQVPFTTLMNSFSPPWTRFFELKRTSATSVEATIYSDASYSVIVEKIRGTFVTSLTDFRFIQLTNEDVIASTGVKGTGTIDEVQFFNDTEGVTQEIVLHGDEDLETPIPSTPLFFDDFSTYASQPAADAAWPPVGVGFVVDITNDVLDVDALRSLVLDQASHDLGTPLSDTDWILRFKFDITTYIAFTAGARSSSFLVAIGDSLSDFDTGPQDQVAFLINTNGDTYNLYWANNETPLLGFAINTVQPPHTAVAETLWIELKRFGGSGIRLTLFADPDFTQFIATAVKDNVPATLTGLQFIRFWDINSPAAPASGDGQIIGTIDDVQVFDGVSSVLEGFTFEDDFSTYGNPLPADFTDVFNSATGWTTTDSTRVRIEDDQGFLFFMSDRGTNDQIAFDLGATVNPGPNIVNDNRWLLRAKFVVTALEDPTVDNHVCYFSIKEDDQTVASGSPNTALVFEAVRTTGGASLFRIRSINNVAMDGGVVAAFTTPMIEGAWYVSMRRITDILLECSLYDDANYSNLIETISVPTVSAVNNLRYISVGNLSTSSVTGGALDITIDDLMFWDGRSTPCDPVTTQGVDWSEDFVTDPGLVTIGTGFSITSQTFEGTGVKNGANNGGVIDIQSCIIDQATADFFDDFTSYASQPVADLAWPSTDVTRTRVNIGTDVIDFNYNNPVANIGISHDLLIVDPSRWTLDCKLRFSTIAPDVNTRIYFGLSSQNETAAINSAADRIMILCRASTGFTDYGSLDTDGTGETGLDNTQSFTFLTGVDYYLRVVRESLTAYHVEVFTDAERQDSLGRVLGTCPATVQDLRYIIIQTVNAVDTATLTGTIDDVSFYDGLSGLISDSEWRLRTKFDLTASPAISTNDSVLYLSVDSADESQSSRGGIHDAISFQINKSRVTQDRNFSMYVTNGGNLIQSFQGSPGQNLDLIANPMFVEIIRTSPTTVTWNVYSDSLYTVLIGTVAGIVSAATIDLRYLAFRSDSVTSGGAGQIVVQLDDVEFVNGGLIPWISSDTDVLFVDICAENLIFLDKAGAKDDSIYFDLETPLSNSKWVMRWSLWIQDALQAASAVDELVWVGIGSVIGGANTVQDFIGINLDIDINTDDQRLTRADGTNLHSGPTVTSLGISNVAQIGTTLYYELIRESSTLGRLSVFSEPTYTFPIVSVTLSLPTSLVGLRYVKVIDANIAGNSPSIIEGNVDNIKIWDGVDVADSFGARRYLQLLAHSRAGPKLPTIHSVAARFNLDEATNYSIRREFNGGGDAGFGSQTLFQWFVFGNAIENFIESSIYNVVNDEKLAQTHMVETPDLLASSGPTRLEHVGKWVTKGTKISRITLLDETGFSPPDGIFDTDTEMVLFGTE